MTTGIKEDGMSQTEPRTMTARAVDVIERAEARGYTVGYAAALAEVEEAIGPERDADRDDIRRILSAIASLSPKEAETP